MKLKSLFIFIFLLLFSSSQLWAIAITPEEEGLFAIRRIGDRLTSVETDAKLIWATGARAPTEWSEALKPSRALLAEYQNELSLLEIPESLSVLRNSMNRLLKELDGFYDRLPSLDEEEMKSAYQELFTHLSAMSKDYADAFQSLVHTPVFSEDDVELVEKETKYFTDKGDLKDFNKGNEYIEAKKFKKALKRFRRLKKDHPGTVIDAIVTERIINCFEFHGSDLDPDKEEQGANLRALDDLLLLDTYYPNLYFLFVQWRTVYQLRNFGASNLSEIPHDIYMKRRIAVFNTINKHINANPDDTWAKTQLIFLTNHPVIVRGGPYGNSVLTDWGWLFGFAEQQEE